MQVQNNLRRRLDLGLDFFRDGEQLVLGSCSHGSYADSHSKSAELFIDPQASG